jgi:hypothetical protein
MKKFVATASLCLFLAGCGASEQDRVISDTFTALNNLSTKLTEINKQVQEAVKSQKTEAKVTEYMQQAVTSAKELKRMGEQTQKLRVDAQRLKEKTTAEASKALAERNRPGLASAVKNLDEHYQALQTTLAQAREQKVAPAMLETLTKELHAGLASFDLLNKQQR